MSKKNFKRYINTRKKARCIRRRMCIIAILTILISVTTIWGILPKSNMMEYGKVICDGTKILLNNNTVISYDAGDYNNDSEVVVIKNGKNVNVVSKYYFVHSGDTIWDIANDVCGNHINKTNFIDKFYKVNNITDGIIKSNTTYTIPLV